jgi:D-sedoheptulose 7-phosphate isomerase
MMNEQEIISEIHTTVHLLEQLAHDSAGTIRQAGELIIESLEAGNKLLVFGNGGSAADAQHFASELVGRYRRDRAPLPAVALTTDTSSLTAISNDYGYSEVFARQVNGLAHRGDVVVGISTSGRSENVIAGLTAARQLDAHTIALTGSDATHLSNLAEIILAVPSNNTARIQEAHGVIIHILCEMVETAFTITKPQEEETGA